MVDWRMLPLLGLLYSIALIDRTNLGIARTAGMELQLVSSTCPFDSPLPSHQKSDEKYRNSTLASVTALPR